MLRTDAMFELVDVATLEPQSDGCWLQGYDLKLLPLPAGVALAGEAEELVAWPLKERLRALRRSWAPAADGPCRCTG